MKYDCVVIGGGAAGLFCAANISSDKKILLLEANATFGRKMMISGGGRCNFTNLHNTFQNYYSSNIQFTRSAFSQFKNNDFIEIVKSYNISYYEKKMGQLFCEKSAKDVINMLVDLCKKNNVELKTNSKVTAIKKQEEDFIITLGQNEVMANKVVIATGGLSIPTIGANDIGYRIAKEFGHEVTDLVPALVPLCLREEDSYFWEPDLSGISLEARATIDKKSFKDGLLFTHKGISGPVVLQISLYWNKNTEIRIDLAPDYKVKEILVSAKNSAQTLGQALKGILPSRLLDQIIIKYLNLKYDKKMAELSQKTIEEISELINDWPIRPHDTEGYRKAEVTRGGVSTHDISSKSFESKKMNGLYFIGEVVDVTGELGGHNFQWAWSSAYTCAQAINFEL